MEDASATVESDVAPVLTGWRALLRDGAQMVRFYSRLPVPRLPFEADAHAMPDFRIAPRMLPVAGLLIGVPGALVLALAALAGLPAFMAAAVAVAVAVFVAGGFHEDGLADTFDGLPGGHTPERRLEIMKDSRIGSFGGSALMLALILRVAGLAGLIDVMGGLSAAVVMAAAAAWSRPAGLLPLVLLPPARPDGFSAAVGRPTSLTFRIAIGFGLIIACDLAWLFGVPLAGSLLGAALGAMLAFAMTGWARRAIGGQTGDIAGACQQFAEIAFYAGILIVLKQVTG